MMSAWCTLHVGVWHLLLAMAVIPAAQAQNTVWVQSLAELRTAMANPQVSDIRITATDISFDDRAYAYSAAAASRYTECISYRVSGCTVGTPVVTRALTIRGACGNATDPGKRCRIRGGGKMGLFMVARASGALMLRGLELLGGFSVNGAGVYVREGSSLVAADTTFRSLTGSAKGGAIFLSAGTHATINSCTLSGNTGEGDVYLDGTDSTLTVFPMSCSHVAGTGLFECFPLGVALGCTGGCVGRVLQLLQPPAPPPAPLAPGEGGGDDDLVSSIPTYGFIAGAAFLLLAPFVTCFIMARRKPVQPVYTAGAALVPEQPGQPRTHNPYPHPAGAPGDIELGGGSESSAGYPTPRGQAHAALAASMISDTTPRGGAGGGAGTGGGGKGDRSALAVAAAAAAAASGRPPRPPPMARHDEELTVEDISDEDLSPHMAEVVGKGAGGGKPGGAGGGGVSFDSPFDPAMSGGGLGRLPGAEVDPALAEAVAAHSEKMRSLHERQLEQLREMQEERVAQLEAIKAARSKVPDEEADLPTVLHRKSVEATAAAGGPPAGVPWPAMSAPPRDGDPDAAVASQSVPLASAQVSKYSDLWDNAPRPLVDERAEALSRQEERAREAEAAAAVAPPALRVPAVLAAPAGPRVLPAFPGAAALSPPYVGGGAAPMPEGGARKGKVAPLLDEDEGAGGRPKGKGGAWVPGGGSKARPGGDAASLLHDGEWGFGGGGGGGREGDAGGGEGDAGGGESDAGGDGGGEGEGKDKAKATKPPDGDGDGGSSSSSGSGESGSESESESEDEGEGAGPAAPAAKGDAKPHPAAAAGSGSDSGSGEESESGSEEEESEDEDAPTAAAVAPAKAPAAPAAVPKGKGDVTGGAGVKAREESSSGEDESSGESGSDDDEEEEEEVPPPKPGPKKMIAPAPGPAPAEKKPSKKKAETSKGDKKAAAPPPPEGSSGSEEEGESEDESEPPTPQPAKGKSKGAPAEPRSAKASSGSEDESGSEEEEDEDEEPPPPPPKPSKSKSKRKGGGEVGEEGPPPKPSKGKGKGESDEEEEKELPPPKPSKGKSKGKREGEVEEEDRGRSKSKEKKDKKKSKKKGR